MSKQKGDDVMIGTELADAQDKSATKRARDLTDAPKTQPRSAVVEARDAAKARENVAYRGARLAIAGYALTHLGFAVNVLPLGGQTVRDGFDILPARVALTSADFALSAEQSAFVLTAPEGMRDAVTAGLIAQNKQSAESAVEIADAGKVAKCHELQNDVMRAFSVILAVEKAKLAAKTLASVATVTTGDALTDAERIADLCGEVRGGIAMLRREKDVPASFARAFYGVAL